MIHDTEAECRTCGAPFYRSTDEQWKTLCLDCWRSSKAKTHDSATCLLCYQRGLVAGRAHRSNAPALDPARIRELLQLAHPDKHAGSPLATRVTSWLLSQRAAV